MCVFVCVFVSVCTWAPFCTVKRKCLITFRGREGRFSVKSPQTRYQVLMVAKNIWFRKTKQIIYYLLRQHLLKSCVENNASLQINCKSTASDLVNVVSSCFFLMRFLTRMLKTSDLCLTTAPLHFSVRRSPETGAGGKNLSSTEASEHRWGIMRSSTSTSYVQIMREKWNQM